MAKSITWEQLKNERLLAKKETPTDNSGVIGNQKVEEVMSPKHPDIVDFSPNGLSEKDITTITDYTNRTVNYIITPEISVAGEHTTLVGAAESLIKSIECDNPNAWGNDIIVALPSSPGFATAIVAAIKNLYGIFPTVVHYKQPDPYGQPGLWEVAGLEELNK